jgi:hypothetical protein
VSSIARLYHLSSHAGDEYLERTGRERIGLSLEVLEGLIAYEPIGWLRLYGGGGVLVNRKPDLDRGLVRFGSELRSPRVFVGSLLRPVLAVDLQLREEGGWRPDASLRTGLRLEAPRLSGRRLELLAEFYDGRAPDGELSERSFRTIGAGVYFDF